MKHFTLLIFGALLGTGMIQSTHAAEMLTLRYGQNATSATSLSSLPLNVAVTSSSSPSRENCLKSGECAAVPMGQPEDLGAIKQGYPRLSFTHEAGVDLIFNVDMTKRVWGEKNQNALIRLVRGFAASHEFINDPKNRTEVTGIVRETLKISDDVAREIFAPYTEPDKNVLPKRGEISIKAFNQVLALMGEAGVIPTLVAPSERFIDLRYLQAAGIQ